MTAGRSAILVLRGGALGDFIVTLPTLLTLRDAYPQSRIVLVGNPVAADLARRRGLIDEVHSQHEARWAPLCGDGPLPTSLRDWLGAFDVVVNFWPDADGAIASHFPVRAEQTFLNAGGPPAVHMAGSTAMPAAAYLARGLEPLGIEPRALYCHFRDRAITWPATATSLGAPARLAVHPGSGSPTKNWPRERWIEFLRQITDLRYRAGSLEDGELVESAFPAILLIAGEIEAAEWSASALRATTLAPRLADGSLQVLASAPLETVIQELRSCDAYIGHDTGISHLAAACGVPSLLLFGPTDPTIWAPPAPHVRVLHPAAGLATLDTATVGQAVRQLLPKAKPGSTAATDL